MGQQTTLAAAITTVGQSSITVSAYQGFPTTAAFTILIGTELLQVTSGYGTTTWTVTRGYDSTTAATHLNGATITLVPDAYAGLSDILATMAVDASTRYDLLLDMAGDVSRDIDTGCMRTFAVPTADVTMYVDVIEWSPSLVEASRGRTTDGRRLDLVSITSLYVRESELDAYVEIAAGDLGYYLQGGPAGTGVAGTDWPYEDVELSPAGLYDVWPLGRRAVKIVGRPGFPVTPSPVKRATVSEVRERFRQSVGGGPSPIGVTGFGTPIFLTGDSPDMRRIMKHPYSKREMVA